MSRAPRSAKAAAAAYKGILSDPGPGIGRYLVHSTLLHGALVVASLLAWAASDPPPPPLAPDAFYVSAVVLPKAQDLPDKPTRAPRPAPGKSGETKAAPPKPNQMVLPDQKKPEEKGPEEPKKEPKKEEPKPRKKSRADLLSSVGDVSDEDRFATDVDGDADAKPTALDARFGQKMSKYDRTVHDRVKTKWQPGLALAQQVSDGVSTVVSFTIKENGAIADIALADGSGNYAFDMSCAVAVQKVGKLPPPPRAPWPVSILFRPEERQ
ncbi:MAG: TonB family protein [Deltaproteobacteria bacterium]|nr:TonB family protein [Deltaproteobacteria bacterium]